jgi:hypothetical protein
LVWALTGQAPKLWWQHGDREGLKHLVVFDAERPDALVVLTNGEAGFRVAQRLSEAVIGACPWRQDSSSSLRG